MDPDTRRGGRNIGHGHALRTVIGRVGEQRGEGGSAVGGQQDVHIGATDRCGRGAGHVPGYRLGRAAAIRHRRIG